MNLKPHFMHQSGAIGGVPGPNNGLWPGGVTVWVNMDTMEVGHVDLIGGGSLVAPVEASAEQTPTDPALPAVEPITPIEASPTTSTITIDDQPISIEDMPQVTPVAEEQVNA